MYMRCSCQDDEVLITDIVIHAMRTLWRSKMESICGPARTCGFLSNIRISYEILADGVIKSPLLAF